MKIQTKEIDHFLEDRVNEGVCSSTIEAERQLSSQLAERELDRNLAESNADYEKGNYKILDDKYIADFTSRIAKKLIRNH